MTCSAANSRGGEGSPVCWAYDGRMLGVCALLAEEQVLLLVLVQVMWSRSAATGGSVALLARRKKNRYSRNGCFGDNAVEGNLCSS